MRLVETYELELGEGESMLDMGALSATHEICRVMLHNSAAPPTFLLQFGQMPTERLQGYPTGYYFADGVLAVWPTPQEPLTFRVEVART